MAGNHKFAIPALVGIAAGDEVLVLTFLHQSRRNVLKVHPRGNKQNPLTGGLGPHALPSSKPDRPPSPDGATNRGNRLLVGPIEAIDGQSLT